MLKKSIFILAFLLLVGKTANATDLKSINSKIASQSPGWFVRKSASGDLNGDGIKDVAAVLVKGEGDTESSIPYDEKLPVRLRIYLGDKSGKFKLKYEAKNAICLFCGGIKGDTPPFDLKISHGVLGLGYFGGSAQFTGQQTHWRLEGDEFYLINLHQEDTNMGAQENEICSIVFDVDFSTLKMVETVSRTTSITEDGEIKSKSHEQKCDVPKSFKKFTLKQFSDKFVTPKCSDDKI